MNVVPVQFGVQRNDADVANGAQVDKLRQFVLVVSG